MVGILGGTRLAKQRESVWKKRDRCSLRESWLGAVHVARPVIGVLAAP
jgi:hypothetical protein